MAEKESVTLPPNNQSHAEPEAPQLDVVWEFEGSARYGSSSGAAPHHPKADAEPAGVL